MVDRTYVGAQCEAGDPEPEPEVEGERKLYRLKQARQRELWHYARLIPKAEFATLPALQLKPEHAESAYCLLCKTAIFFRTGQSGSVRDHMEKIHADKIQEYLDNSKPANAANRNKMNLDMTSMTQDRASKRKIVDVGEQERKHADILLARWVAQSLRPIAVVEDQGFRDYVEFIARALGGVKLKIPKRTQLRQVIVQLASDLRAALKTKLRGGCSSHAMTTDIWADRSQRSFMALTIHYLDIDFSMFNWTLEVEHFPGIHTGDAIAIMLEKTMERWGLQKDRCTVLLRGGAANAVSAGDKLGVAHMSCIVHSLYLVVAGALVRKRGASDTDKLFSSTEHESQAAGALREEACVEVEQHMQKMLGHAERAAMTKIRAIVQAFRNVASFFHRSPKGKNRLLKIQSDLSPKPPLGAIMDCPTRWSSCRDMLARLVDLQTPLDHFFGYLCTPEGKKELKCVSLTHPPPAHWLTVRRLLALLTPFVVATEALSGENYPTLAMTFPWIRAVQSEFVMG